MRAPTVPQWRPRWGPPLGTAEVRVDDRDALTDELLVRECHDVCKSKQRKLLGFIFIKAQFWPDDLSKIMIMSSTDLVLIFFLLLTLNNVAVLTPHVS